MKRIEGAGLGDVALYKAPDGQVQYVQILHILRRMGKPIQFSTLILMSSFQ